MRKKATNKQKAYIVDYNKENYRRVNLSLHRTIDADIIAWIEAKDNIAGYIKELIRQDMKKGSE